MDCSSRSGGRRLKDRLTQLLLRPANTLLRSPCSSSSSTSTVFTATAATTTSISSNSSSTTAANYTTAAALSRAEPFSAALGRLRRPPPETESMRGNKEQRSTSSRHSGRRRFKNAVDKGGVRTLSSNPYGFTSSSEEDDGTDVYDDDGDDTETFLSSRSLVSSDSSVFYAYRKMLLPPSKNKSHLRRQRRRRRCCRRPSASCMETCGAGAVREPGFRPLVATATATAAAVEQVRKGLAVVKRSRDPYGDFRESMVEMIMGRQVFGAAELERLLRSYLLLNAPRFHPVILQAFSDVWVVIHGG